MQEDVSRRVFALGLAGATVAVTAFLLGRLHAWPPHEDETLALFVGSKPLGELFSTVLDVRGGAPLHFLLVHLATQVSPTLDAVRLLSVLFAVASIPTAGLLVARLTDRRTALVATLLVAASWVTLFHGIYGRMYSLFLFTSALSFLALLRAAERNSRLSWAAWAIAVYATLASHQYGLFVLAAQVLFAVYLRLRGRASLLPGAVALAAVIAAAVPLWRSSLVLASRFDVGVGGDGTQLGGPLRMLEYLRNAIGDFAAGWTLALVIVCALATLGIVQLWRRRQGTAVLAFLVFAVPAAALAIARASATATLPETRHLIYTLPFFTMLVATGILRLARLAGHAAAPVAAVSAVALAVAAVAWGWHITPTLYRGEPSKRKEAREAAVAWLTATTRPDDVLFGYDPLFLGAREHGGDVGDTVIPRADPKLALRALTDARKPLGRGVWVLDASDGSRIVSNDSSRLVIERRSPGPGFESRAFGPFLIIRTTAPTRTAAAFLHATVLVQRLGLGLYVGNSIVNYETARLALDSLENGS